MIKLITLPSLTPIEVITLLMIDHTRDLSKVSHGRPESERGSEREKERKRIERQRQTTNNTIKVYVDCYHLSMFGTSPST